MTTVPGGAGGERVGRSPLEDRMPQARVNIGLLAENPLHAVVVIVIRRLVDRRRAYTGIFLPGEKPRVFPTTDAEHGRILQIYKQDRPHEGIINDFSEFGLGRDTLAAEPAAAAVDPLPPARDFV